MIQEYTITVDRFKSHQHSNAISTRGGYASMYKKSANKSYELDIINQLQDQHVHKYGFNAYSCPVSLSIEFYVKIPTTVNKERKTAKERREMQGAWAPSKPDLTNIIKTIEDCIERAGIIDDDMNIVKYDNIEKRYNFDVKGKKEMAIIKIKKLTN